MVSGKEGTVSTASRNCRNHGQRLQDWGTNAPQSSGSFGVVPRALRPERLQWLNNLSGKQKNAPVLTSEVEQLRRGGRRTPCDLGLCKRETEAKTAAPVLRDFKPFFSERSLPRQGAASRHPPPFSLILRCAPGIYPETPRRAIQHQRAPP